MPSRAFLFFPQWKQKTDQTTNAKLSQCPRGHFCFFHTCSCGAQFHNGMKSQCPRGHFCFFHGNTNNAASRRPPRGGSQCPRGHFCFFHVFTTTNVASMVRLSQCPRGHFCFFPRGRCVVLRCPGWGLNALAGIFVFFHNNTIVFSGHLASGVRWSSQCPRGHFCFFHSDGDNGVVEPKRVSMPSRAFLFFHGENMTAFNLYLGAVSMLSRAFLFFRNYSAVARRCHSRMFLAGIQ